MARTSRPPPIMSEAWWYGPLVGLDFETTSANPETARPVSVALVTVDGTNVHSWSELIDCGEEIPEEAAAIHGITTEMVDRDGEAAQAVLEMIMIKIRSVQHSGIPLVIYNSPYDLTVLDRELERQGLPTLDHENDLRPVIDPLVISQRICAWKRPHTLERACEQFHVPYQGPQHDAAVDAFQAVRLAWRLIDSGRALMDGKVINLCDATPDQLHDHQVEWYRASAEKFVENQRDKGREPEGVNFSWPYPTKLRVVR